MELYSFAIRECINVGSYITSFCYLHYIHISILQPGKIRHKIVKAWYGIKNKSKGIPNPDKLLVARQCPAPTLLPVEHHGHGQHDEDEIEDADFDHAVSGLSLVSFLNRGTCSRRKEGDSQGYAHLVLSTPLPSQRLAVNVNRHARVLFTTLTPTIPSSTISGYASMRYAILKSPAQPHPNPMNPRPT